MSAIQLAPTSRYFQTTPSRAFNRPVNADAVKFGCIKDVLNFIPKDLDESELHQYPARPLIDFNLKDYEKAGLDLNLGQKICLYLIWAHQKHSHRGYDLERDQVHGLSHGKQNFNDVCGYYVSCSNFGNDAIAIDGVLWGGYQTVLRLIRCNPIYLKYIKKDKAFCKANGHIKVKDFYYNLDDPSTPTKYMRHYEPGTPEAKRQQDRVAKLDRIIKARHQQDIAKAETAPQKAQASTAE